MTALSGDPVAIVLAAGASQRLGKNKLFVPIEGIPLIERVITSFRKARKVHDEVVVVPPGMAGEFSWLRSVKTHLLENPDPSGGMISSIRVALDSTWAKGRDFLLCPGDIPFIPHDVVDRLVSTYLARPCRIVVPTYKGLGGHPAMFAAALADDFFLHGDLHGTREILMRHRGETVRINVPDPDICFDVDTPDDLEIAGDAGARWARVERQVEDKRKARLG